MNIMFIAVKGHLLECEFASPIAQPLSLFVFANPPTLNTVIFFEDVTSLLC